MERPAAQSRVVRFTNKARLDFAGIDNTTSQQWGDMQADRCVGFLREILSHLAENPTLGKKLEVWPEYRVYTAKFNKRRSAQGHRIFYAEIEGGTRVIRILHTAMNWRDHLG